MRALCVRAFCAPFRGSWTFSLIHRPKRIGLERLSWICICKDYFEQFAVETRGGNNNGFCLSITVKMWCARAGSQWPTLCGWPPTDSLARLLSSSAGRSGCSQNRKRSVYLHTSLACIIFALLLLKNACFLFNSVFPLRRYAAPSTRLPPHDRWCYHRNHVHVSRPSWWQQCRVLVVVGRLAFRWSAGRTHHHALIRALLERGHYKRFCGMVVLAFCFGEEFVNLKECVECEGCCFPSRSDRKCSKRAGGQPAAGLWCRGASRPGLGPAVSVITARPVAEYPHVRSTTTNFTFHTWKYCRRFLYAHTRGWRSNIVTVTKNKLNFSTVINTCFGPEVGQSVPIAPDVKSGELTTIAGRAITSLKWEWNVTELAISEAE